jgi:hypothetical protein
MTPDESEHMRSLCEQIAKEQDREKFTKLIQELNNLLEHKERQVERPRADPEWNSAARMMD